MLALGLILPFHFCGSLFMTCRSFFGNYNPAPVGLIFLGYPDFFPALTPEQFGGRPR
jgi:hypothetical protein